MSRLLGRSALHNAGWGILHPPGHLLDGPLLVEQILPVLYASPPQELLHYGYLLVASLCVLHYSNHCPDISNSSVQEHHSLRRRFQDRQFRRLWQSLQLCQFRERRYSRPQQLGTSVGPGQHDNTTGGQLMHVHNKLYYSVQNSESSLVVLIMYTHFNVLIIIQNFAFYINDEET